MGTSQEPLFVLSSAAKAISPGRVPTRQTNNRHRKQAKVGRFAQSAAQHDIHQRGDGWCVAGKWIADNLDSDDIVEFIRLASGHKWRLIERLSDNNLKEASLSRHVHGNCTCVGAGGTTKGCCTCDKTEGDS